MDHEQLLLKSGNFFLVICLGNYSLLIVFSVSELTQNLYVDFDEWKAFSSMKWNYSPLCTELVISASKFSHADNFSKVANYLLPHYCEIICLMLPLNIFLTQCWWNYGLQFSKDMYQAHEWMHILWLYLLDNDDVLI